MQNAFVSGIQCDFALKFFLFNLIFTENHVYWINSMDSYVYWHPLNASERLIIAKFHPLFHLFPVSIQKHITPLSWPKKVGQYQVVLRSLRKIHTIHTKIAQLNTQQREYIRYLMEFKWRKIHNHWI